MAECTGIQNGKAQEQTGHMSLSLSLHAIRDGF